MIKRFWDQEFEVIDLKEQGYITPTFEVNEAIAFMRFAVTKGVRILGGDIIIKNGNDYIISADNWYSNSLEPNETLKCAIEFLQAYQQIVDTGEWFVAVVTDNLADLLFKNNL